MVPRLAEARHRALTGFEPTVLCAASVPAPVAEPVDAPDSKSGVRKDVPVRVGPGAPRKINDLGDPRTAHGMRVGKIISEALAPWLRPTLPAALLFTRAHIRNVFAKGGGEVYLMVLLVN